MSTEAPENVSNAKQFKKLREARDKGEILKLPSGLSVLLKKPDITKMIATGLLPTNLVSRFMALEKTNADNMSGEDFKLLLDYQKSLAKYSLLAPKITDKPDYDNDEIAIDDLSTEDMQAIWEWVNGGTEQADKFRSERKHGLPAGPASEKIPE